VEKVGDKLVQSLGGNFERILRWIYPGALFLVLLRMSKPHAFKSLATPNDIGGPWELIIAGLVAGFAAYLIQAYALNHLVSLVFQVANWDINTGLHVNVRSGAGQPKLGLERLAHLFDRHAQATWLRWGGNLPEGLSNYLSYGWATYHAVSMTGWLTLLFFLKKDCDSAFAAVPSWQILLPAALMLLGALWTYAHLSRVPLEAPGNRAA